MSYGAMITDLFFGWRMQSEVLTLERRQLDLKAGTIRLDGGSTKNADGRVVYLTPELATLLREQIGRVQTLGRQFGRIIPCLFPHLPQGNVPRHLVGSKRVDFRKAWATACTDAGVPDKLRHDFRRTAVRNMVNRVSSSGWRWRSPGTRPAPCSTATTS